MLVTDQYKLELVDQLKKHSTSISELEILSWAAYDYNKAYDYFWPNQYLKLYIQILEDSVKEGVELTEHETNHIIESAKEIVFYTLNITI